MIFVCLKLQKQAEISKIKIGRLTPQDFDDIFVQAYGKKNRLAEIGQFVPKSVTSMTFNLYDESLQAPTLKVNFYILIIMKHA